jgi:hypothetical protein
VQVDPTMKMSGFYRSMMNKMRTEEAAKELIETYNEFEL